jgi:cobalamin biosynthesis protein CobD/CbiB
VGEFVTALATASASSSAQPGTLAFLIIFGMAIVLFFLFRSMSKHLRKVNAAARRSETAAASDAAAQDPVARDVASASPPDRRGEP